MSETIISVEHLTKLYDLGAINTGTLSKDINRWWARLHGNPDPYLKIDQVNKFDHKDDRILAINDVNFQVHQGEALGIIGQNGAGKSTLLKILSRITAPTSGKVKMNGRVGSLLEVGTGFHPELTGRENTYLNGAILGMSRKEIDRKFDEIVDFSGVEQFIDTPVKRYSSGMYVRLAFAVAAHLEPEILIVDEVLAVGDTDFQKKCLSKMGDVANEGRTVLFVSHNLGAITTLCSRAILLEKGKIIIDSDANNVVHQYLNKGINKDVSIFYRKDFNKKENIIHSVEILNSEMKHQREFIYGDTINVLINTNEDLNKKFSLQVRVKNSKQEILGFTSSLLKSKDYFHSGQSIIVTIPQNSFVQDDYFIDFICNIPNIEHLDNFWDCVNFSIINCKPGFYPSNISSSNYLGSVIFNSFLYKKKN